MELITLIVWILAGAGAYKMAESRGRNEWGWVAGTVLLSPIVGLLLLLILGDTQEMKVKKAKELKALVG
jgi:hypothetical protein